jgi:hypothetical protein
VLAERTPADKVEAVRLERRAGPTVMVGDGVNDAPALAAADVGVAMATRGSTASSEAADVLLTVDRLDRLGEARRTARRSQRIAAQSVLWGMSLSVLAMGAAAMGWLPPAWGALLQEGIDVAVILNALRALGGDRRSAHLQGHGAELARRFSAEHQRLRPRLAAIRAVADSLGTAPEAAAMAELREVHRFLVEDLAPHEAEEDRVLYPVLAETLGGTDRTSTMSRAHVEIAHRIRRLGRLLDGLEAAPPTEEDLGELRRALYGLHAILELHFAQEDEGYLSLADDAPEPDAVRQPAEGRDPAGAASHPAARRSSGLGP